MIQWWVYFYLREVWTHKDNLAPPYFIEVSVPSQKSERACICVLGVSILIFDFGIVQRRVLRYQGDIQNPYIE